MAPEAKKLNILPTPMAKNVLVQKSETVSIRVLLVFLNNTLDCDLRSMDELKTGAVYCQIMHRLFPTSIQIQKVKFYTNNKSDFEINFRLLHNCLTKLKIKRFMPVEELIVGHNHVDFCNWIYKFYRVNDNGQEYDAKKVRKDMPIGLSKSPELASFATGSQNAIYKCQSMIFNYSKDTSRLDRRSSLDGRSCRPTKSKKSEPEKLTKPLLPKKAQTPKACDYLEEVRNIPLPPEAEDEVEERSAQQAWLQNLFMEKLNSKKKGPSAVTYTIETSKNTATLKNCPKPKALNQKCEQATKDLQNKNETISNLNYEISRLTTKQEMLAKKVWTVEHILLKYGDKPEYAVQELKEIIFNNSQLAAVSPRTRPGDGPTCSKCLAVKQKPARNSMPSRYCNEFRTCIDFSPEECKDKKPKEPHFNADCRSIDDHSPGCSRCQCNSCRRYRQSYMDQDNRCDGRNRSPDCTPSCYSRDDHRRQLHHEVDLSRCHRRCSRDRYADQRHAHPSCSCKHTKSMQVCISNCRNAPDCVPHDEDFERSRKEGSNVTRVLNQNDLSKGKK